MITSAHFVLTNGSKTSSYLLRCLYFLNLFFILIEDDCSQPMRPAIVVMLLSHLISYCLSGTNCSESLRADNFRVRWMPFRCDVSLVPSPPNFLTSDLLQITAEFDLTSGTIAVDLR